MFEFLGKVLKGEEKLWKVFWLFGFIGNLAFVFSLLEYYVPLYYYFIPHLKNNTNFYIFLLGCYSFYFLFSSWLIRKNIHNTIYEEAALHFRPALHGTFVLMIILLLAALASIISIKLYYFLYSTWQYLFMPVVGGIAIFICAKALLGFSKF